jgi:hypothetical protein
MNKTALLAATAVLALTAGGASAGAPHPTALATGVKSHPIHLPPTGVLYSQNSNGSGSAVVSQNFTSGFFSTYDAALADDFVVPAGHTWSVSEVDVTGEYFNGPGPATSEVVTFYKNKTKKGVSHPGKVVDAYTLTCTDSDGSFACVLPTKGKKGKPATKLKAGTYWLSVVANLAYLNQNETIVNGEWGWESTTNAIQGSESQWQNPGGGFGVGCTSWTDTSTCIGSVAADLMFDLQGTG